MLNNIWTNIKNFITALAVFTAGVFALLFVYTRNRAQINEALVKQQNLNKELDKHDANIASNNQELVQEEAKRKELSNEKTDSNNVIDISKRLSE